MRSRKLRIAMFSPHYAEYSVRLALALGRHASVLLVLDHHNRLNEVSQDLLQGGAGMISTMEFVSRTRVGRRLARVLVPLRILCFRPDVVHVQEQPDAVTAAVVKVLGFFHAIVLTVHDPKPHSGNDAAYAARMDRYRQVLRQAASVYHVHGSFCGSLMATMNPAGKPVVATAHGVLMVPLASAKRDAQAGRILLFGRMEAYKGVEDLLDAADKLAARGTPCHLVLAGRGPELARLQDRLARSPAATVIDKFLTPQEAIAQFQAAAVVVVPYRDATQSGVVAAAYGNGRAVVACSVGGLVDAVRDGVDGLLVPPRSTEALAAAMARVLEDPSLRQRLERGACLAAKGSFNWDAIAPQLIDAYKAVRTGRAAGSTSSLPSP